MAARLAKRVSRLERARSPACAECGGGGAGPVVYGVRIPEASERVTAAHAARPPEACRKCGRPTRFWISMLAARADG